MDSGICVIAEHKSNSITDGTFEAISAGRSIAKQLNTGVALLVLGNGLSALSNTPSHSSADTVYLFDNPLLAQYTSDAYIRCLEPFIKQQKPSILFIPSTCLGRDLAPKLAARLKTAYMSDVSGIEISGREILLSRPVYGGRLVSTVTCIGEKPWVITLRPRAFEKGDTDSKNAKTENPAVNLSPEHIRTVIKGIEQTQKGLGLTEADIIISGGRGMKGPENFKMLENLAKILGGVVGASGAAVDAGWMPHSAQVGQTGKVVSPKLYIACGISGAPQHLAGMSTSKCIVAINKDPDAPIFQWADYGIVGDLFEVVPTLMEELKR
ncbi:MAG TPA: electron transfer flavoprotein subunit alpha/FixB family protein [Thermodesulfobacteriota bacterium]|nr:electron transfer flavoprotein subunit alpha/FixB family protein [Thermodesulfobacteriota bacterium]